MRLAVGLLGLLLLVVCWTGSVYLPYARPVEQGISLFGAHFNDGVNNIALISSLKNSIPPQNPNFSGQNIVGYHYFINLVIAMAENFFGGDPFVVYFGVVPILLLVLLSAFIYLLTSRMVGRFLGAISVLFALLLSNYYYFAGTNPSVAWVDEYSTKLVNYQYLSSLVIIVGLLILVFCTSRPIFLGLISGLLMGFKIYAWILWIAALGIVGTYNFFIRKESYLIKIFLWSVFFSVPVYLLFFYGAKNTGFYWDPLWIIRSMYSSPDRLASASWELARQYYISIKNYLGLTKLYGIGAITFLLINLGPRLLGFVTNFNDNVIKLMKFMAILGLCFALLLGQSGSSWNVIQFSYYSVFLLAILLALGFKNYSHQSKILVISVLLIISLPGSIYTNNVYSRPPYTGKFSVQVVEGLKFLAVQPMGVVLVHSEYASNAIVSAISGKPTFLAEEMILNSYGTNIMLRKKETSQFFEGRMLNYDSSWFRSHDIKYVVAPVSWLSPYWYLRAIFSNDSLNVYAVNL